MESIKKEGERNNRYERRQASGGGEVNSGYVFFWVGVLSEKEKGGEFDGIRSTEGSRKGIEVQPGGRRWKKRANSSNFNITVS